VAPLGGIPCWPTRLHRGEFDLIVFGRMSAYEPCNFYAPFGDRPQAVPEFYEDVCLVLIGPKSGMMDLIWSYIVCN